MKKKLIKAIFYLLLTITILLPNGDTANAYSFRVYPTHIRIGLLEFFNNRPSITIGNVSISYGNIQEQTVQGKLHSSSGFTVQPHGTQGIRLVASGQTVAVFDHSPQFSDYYGGFMVLGNASFRGAIEFVRSGSNITAVNVISIEEYLFSVVPSEMPPSWSAEALKAQAVAARTYALFHMGNSTHNAQGFDLCDLVHCQRYRGTVNEAASSTAAVMATAGRIALFDGQVINAVYFASSGGMTENSENVWAQALPYLRSVNDPFEHETPLWTRTFTLSEINTLLSRNNRSIGTATNIYVGGNHPSGRVESLVIQGTTGQITLTREEIRTFFAPSSGGVLPSRMFVIESTSPVYVTVFDGMLQHDAPLTGLYSISVDGIPVPINELNASDGINIVTYYSLPPSAAIDRDAIVFSGRGAGHGVGMSQRGAEGLARRGYTYEEILMHFYLGITVESIS